MITNPLRKKIREVILIGEAYNNSNLLKNRKDEIERNFFPVYNQLYTKLNYVFSLFCALNKACIFTYNFDIVKINLVSLKAKLAADDYDKTLAANIKKDLEQAEQAIKDKWKLYIAERVSSKIAVLDTLSAIIKDVPEKVQLDQKRMIFNLEANLGSDYALNALDSYIKIYDELMDKLQLNPAVMAFLKLLSSSRSVTLCDMSIDVFEWIKTSGFSSKISVKIGF